MPDVHLVLGAGGMKCISYAGALAVLEERGYRFASVSAVSAGSLLGALLSAGIRAGELQRLVSEADLARLGGSVAAFWYLPFVGSLWRWPFAKYRESGIPDFLRGVLGADPVFADLRIPFATIGIDLVARRILVYSSRSTPAMKVSDALRIAVSVPFLYPAQESGGRIMVDGAFASQAPVWLAAEYDDELPVVVLKPRTAVEFVQRRNPIGLLTSLVELGGATRDHYLIRQMARTNVIDIDTGNVRYDDFGMSRQRKQQLVAAGRAAAEDALTSLALAARGAPPARAAAGDPVPADDYNAAAEAGGSRVMARFNSGLSIQVRNRVFISYSHRDRDWLEKFRVGLKPYLRERDLELWDDGRIAAGTRWRDEIEDALRHTKIALLLVTRNFLASDFIMNVELQAFLTAAQKEGVIILWVAVGASAYEETPLRDYQCANDPNVPLNGLSEADQDRELVRIGKQVKVALA